MTIIPIDSLLELTELVDEIDAKNKSSSFDEKSKINPKKNDSIERSQQELKQQKRIFDLNDS